MKDILAKADKLYIKYVTRYLGFGVIYRSDATDILDLIERDLIKAFGSNNINVMAACVHCMDKLAAITAIADKYEKTK